MINRDVMYAFIDECGTNAFNLKQNPDSTLFIVTSILVKEKDLNLIETELQKVRQQNFSGNEIKSNGIKGNHKRRVTVLNKVLGLPFKIVSLVVDKKAIYAEHGIRKNKKTFYKFINQLLYNELRVAYPNVKIVADNVGENDFVEEFKRYVETHRKPINLFDTDSFEMVNSNTINGVQLADLIAGTFSYIYEDNKKNTVPSDIDYLRMLEKKILRTKFFPRSYDEKLFEHIEGNNEYNKDIALTSYRTALNFIGKYEKDNDEFRKRQVHVLNYLLFRFKYNSLRRYIPTKELMNTLASSGYSSISEQVFRNKVIGKLRDTGVIISSSHKGYKLPSSEKEIYDYYSHIGSIVIPMLNRLNTCNDLLKVSSESNKDFLEDAEFTGLKVIADALRNKQHN